MTALEITTLSIAIWGAVLSTIAFGWNIFRAVTHHGKLRVSCYRAIIIGVGYRDEKTYLAYNITNIGKEPVLVTHFGGTIKDPKHNAFCITPESGEIPKMLQPGEQIFLKTNIDLMKEFLNETLLTLNVTDSLGRKFNCPKRDIKKILKEEKEANQSTHSITAPGGSE